MVAVDINHRALQRRGGGPVDNRPCARCTGQQRHGARAGHDDVLQTVGVHVNCRKRRAACILPEAVDTPGFLKVVSKAQSVGRRHDAHIVKAESFVTPTLIACRVEGDGRDGVVSRERHFDAAVERDRTIVELGRVNIGLPSRKVGTALVPGKERLAPLGVAIHKHFKAVRTAAVEATFAVKGVEAEKIKEERVVGAWRGTDPDCYLLGIGAKGCMRAFVLTHHAASVGEAGVAPLAAQSRGHVTEVRHGADRASYFIRADVVHAAARSRAIAEVDRRETVGGLTTVGAATGGGRGEVVPTAVGVPGIDKDVGRAVRDAGNVGGVTEVEVVVEVCDAVGGGR